MEGVIRDLREVWSVVINCKEFMVFWRLNYYRWVFEECEEGWIRESESWWGVILNKIRGKLDWGLMRFRIVLVSG